MKVRRDRDRVRARVRDRIRVRIRVRVGLGLGFGLGFGFGFGFERCGFLSVGMSTATTKLDEAPVVESTPARVAVLYSGHS